MGPLARASAGGTRYLEGGRGPALVLLHGIPGSAHAWEGVAERLCDSFRVVLPDLAGFGESEAPGADWYMEGQARRLRTLLDRLGIRDLVLGGHDFGGPVALTLWRLHPELRVRALVLSSTNLFTDTQVPPPLRLAPVPLLGDLVFRAMAGSRVGLRMMHRTATARRDVLTWERFARHLTPSGVNLTRRIFQHSLADLETNYRPVQGSLASVDVPTLVLWGDRDPFFAVPVGVRSQRAIPKSELRVVEGTGHFVPEESPHEVAVAIREFLARRLD